MKKKKKQTHRAWQAGLVFALLLLLCGCTKKEELILLGQENEADWQDDFPEQAGSQTVLDGAAAAGRAFAGEDRQMADIENRGEEKRSGDGAVQTDAETAAPGVIYVHVCGAVKRPGVYELEPGCRVYEAVKQAGGFAEGAEENYVNQAQVLEDGVKLVIPTREEAAAVRGETAGEMTAAAGAGESLGIVEGAVQAGAGEGIGIIGGASSGGQDKDAGSTSGGRININTATETQLCEIPGIGATRAAAIAAYRESHGAFEKPEDIMKVNGIKEGMYEKIKDSISVN